ncbi:hypothetical protein [Ktedonospora formicarum]|uniref:Uncharacterized protein n=1 Tax=Ktedonospora formicarum TaxID=2778364 RepID=A0A8J3I897_9CHLR|nr:hypothetical protein [Ktedonospora formicarum]GHO49291.1 hypothetical protein KSX_74540 [Ktedonospora formicarum]
MWQTICISLPSLTREQQCVLDQQLRLAMHNYDLETDTIDVGLFFLRYMRPDEAVLILEERRALVQRNLERVLDEYGIRKEDAYAGAVRQIIREHIRLILQAELEWIASTMRHLHELSAA